jgi:AraC-like DNA-binding protein
MTNPVPDTEGGLFIARRPPWPLALYVDTLWFASRAALPHRRERSLPTGCADIVIPLLQPAIVRHDDIGSADARHLPGAIVAGVHDRFTVRGMGGASSVIGVHFRPGGAAAFFGGALPALRNRTELLEDLWGMGVRGLRERLQSASGPDQRFALVEAALTARLRAAPAPDPLVRDALRAFARDPGLARVGTVQRASRSGAAQFIQRFEDAVGITPKRYARVMRLRALLARIATDAPRHWAALAVDAGYADQSHLNHEFKRMTGLTPTAYRVPDPSRPTHVPVADPPVAPDGGGSGPGRSQAGGKDPGWQGPGKNRQYAGRSQRYAGRPDIQEQP